MPGEKRVFLTAEWRDLAMLNYEVQPGLLAGYVPPGTTLDSFEGKTYVSLVGFCFSRTRLWGNVAVPLHGEFEEVNLRFYVRRREGSEERRGVCFIAEIVPKRAIAWTARLVYGENYRRFPMEHRVARNALGKTAEYGWRVGDRSCRLLCTQRMSPDIHTKEVWNSSLPSTIGDTPSSRQAGVLSIASRMRRGVCQWRQARDLRAMRRRHMGQRLQRFFEGNLIPRFLRRDLRLRYLLEKESHQ